MKPRSRTTLAFAAALVGLAFTAASAHAQLVINLREQALFGPFTGGTNNNVTNNGSISSGGTNITDVITTGLPVVDPFTISYRPLTAAGPTLVTLNTGTLNTAAFDFHAGLSNTQDFTSLMATINLDFDNNGIFDLTQNYTINLAPFTSPNGFTGISYAIIPQQFFGSVLINGTSYGYASVVSNSVGTLFDGSSTTAALQFQFLATPVPEPSTYALAGVLALGGIVALRRRRSPPAGFSALAA